MIRDTSYIKLFLGVITVSIITGIGIFFITNHPINQSNISSNDSSYKKDSTGKNTDHFYPTPIPTPSLSPLTNKSNLSDEVDKLTPNDYSQDFDNLRRTNQ